MEPKTTGYKRQCDDRYLAHPSGPAIAQGSMCHSGSNAPGTVAAPLISFFILASTDNACVVSS